MFGRAIDAAEFISVCHHISWRQRTKIYSLRAKNGVGRSRQPITRRGIRAHSPLPTLGATWHLPRPRPKPLAPVPPYGVWFGPEKTPRACSLATSHFHSAKSSRNIRHLAPTPVATKPLAPVPFLWRVVWILPSRIFIAPHGQETSATWHLPRPDETPSACSLPMASGSVLRKPL